MIAPTDEQVEAALVWRGSDARSPRGDLYSVHQLSENVFQTAINGTALPGWKPTLEEARSVAQDNYNTRLPSLLDRLRKPIDWKHALTEGDEWQIDEDRKDAVAALTAAFSLAAPAGTVKSLVWLTPHGNKTMKKAETIIGNYRVWTYHDAESWFWAGPGVQMLSHGVVDEAAGIVAAEANYVARVSTALLPPQPSAGDSKP